MLPLQRIGYARPARGKRVDIPFSEVAKAVDFRTTELAILAAAPGGGKTSLAVNWAWRTTDPVLYFAMDTPVSTLRRLYALANGKMVSEIETEDFQYWGDKIPPEKRAELVLVEGAVTTQQIRDHIEALSEWLMETPRLVILDNLYNVRVEGAHYMDNSFYASVLPELKQLALDLDVGLVVMHHVGRSGDHGKKTGQGDVPFKMSDLLFGGEREARHVWGLYRGPDRKELIFQVLKQTDGEADAGGGVRIHLDWIPTQAYVGDSTRRTSYDYEDYTYPLQGMWRGESAQG